LTKAASRTDDLPNSKINRTFAAKLCNYEHLDYLFINGRRPAADGRRHDTFVSADYIKK